MAPSEPSIAVRALLAERVRILGRRDGAHKRMQFAQGEVAKELSALEECQTHLRTIEAAVVELGGEVPPEVAPEDAPAPQLEEA